MVTHTKSQFEAVVAGLNQAFDGWMVFQLAGSLTDKPASFHDADIIVYPKFSSGVKGFLRGCTDAGIEVVALDDTSRTPFPGRPDGQDRIQVKLVSGHTVDLFFPKGYLSEASTK